MQLLSIISLASTVLSQFTCSTGNQRSTFAMCVNNIITDPLTNRGGFTDPVQACSSILQTATQKTYYGCICTRATQAATCYNPFCMGDPMNASSEQVKTQYCAAYDALPADPVVSDGAILEALPTFARSSPSAATVLPSPRQTTAAAVFTSADTMLIDRMGLIFNFFSGVLLILVFFGA